MPGRTDCASVMPASASACASVSAPVIVTGAIAPASVNGVMIRTWPDAAKSMMPSAMGMSSCSGEFVLITVQVYGRSLNSSAPTPWAMRSSSKQSAICFEPRE